MREKKKKDLNKGTSSASTVEEKWNRLKEAIQTAEAKYTPVRPHNPLVDNFKRSTPLENKTVKLIQKKHRLWTRYMETRDKKYHQEFRKIRNKVKSLTRQAKREYEKSIAIQAKSNPKKFWNHARSKTKVKTGISDIDYKDESGQLCTTKSEEEKAHELGEFFRSVGPVPLYVETERNRAKPSYHVETGSIGGDVIEIYTPY